jgi:hypothetical protein
LYISFQMAPMTIPDEDGDDEHGTVEEAPAHGAGEEGQHEAQSIRLLTAVTANTSVLRTPAR